MRMQLKARSIETAIVLAVVLSTGFIVPMVQAQTRVFFGVTETSETYNPYGDSNSLMYGIWCQVYGCLIDYDFEKGRYVPNLAERWEVKDPNTWLFYLRKDAKFHNGQPLTAADVLHSYNRVKTDPQSKQRQNVRPIAEVEALSKHTVKITTKRPIAPLLAYLTQFIITSKAIYDKYGPQVADRKYPFGAGPYKLKELIPGQRIVIAKNLDYPGMKEKKEAPDEVIFRIMREPEVRATALLNGEIEVAQRIPPHLARSLEKDPNIKVVPVASVEIMFLGMSPKHKPWDNKLLRQAVAYAIDRDTIIATILEGRATRLDGPLGPGQYGYNPNLQPRYKYDPEKARRLVIQAGFPNGVDVDFYTSVGRYTMDKQIGEAIVPMLRAVGIQAKLHTPEIATYWANIQKGRVPFYYWGRGGVIDPSPALAQYFGTGVSPRIGYSNPEVDRLLALERKTFDPVKRKEILFRAMSIITEDAPAHFMWRQNVLFGISKKVDFKPRPDNRIFAEKIRVLR